MKAAAAEPGASRETTFDPLEIAQKIAPGWLRQSAFVEKIFVPIREWMIRELGPGAGDTVLELAAGSGDTGFEVAGMLGDAGRLISSDFSATMLDGARRRGEELGVPNVDFRVIDAQRIELEEESVDGVLCRMGLMLMPDRKRALGEIHRVLRPDGRLVLAVWASPERNPYFVNTAIPLVQRGLIPPPDPEGPWVFSMADPDRTLSLLEGAGFNSILIEELPIQFEFGDLDQLLRFTADTAGPLGLILQSLPDHDLQSVKADYQQAFEPFAVDSGYRLPGAVQVARAHR